MFGIWYVVEEIGLLYLYLCTGFWILYYGDVWQKTEKKWSQSEDQEDQEKPKVT